MNQAQQRLIWGGALVAGLLAAAGVRELSKPGLSCRDKIYGFVDRRGRWVTFKKRECDSAKVGGSMDDLRRSRS